jgi:hypothetical protein
MMIEERKVVFAAIVELLRTPDSVETALRASYTVASRRRRREL